MPWTVIHAGTGELRSLRLSAGKYPVERIPNPTRANNDPWIVVRGTTIGASEAFWRRFADPSWGDFRVELIPEIADEDMWRWTSMMSDPVPP